MDPTKTWKEIKDNGLRRKKVTERRDTLDRDFESFQNWAQP